MFFNKASEDSPDETAESTTNAPRSSLTRTKGSNDLRTLLESFNTKMSLHSGENDDFQVELFTDNQDYENVFSPAPVPSTSPEPYIIAPIPTRATIKPIHVAPTKNLSFDNIAQFTKKMEGLLRQTIEMSQDQMNPLADFLQQAQYQAYQLQWKKIVEGMREFLVNGDVPEYDAFLHAFDNYKASKGFSMNCYLTLHNPRLGAYLLQNEVMFNEINDAFHCYVSDPRKRSSIARIN